MSVAKMSDSNVKVDDKFVFGETNKSEAFLKKFPLGKVPIPISYPQKIYGVLLIPFEAARSPIRRLGKLACITFNTFSRRDTTSYFYSHFGEFWKVYLFLSFLVKFETRLTPAAGNL